MAHAIKTLGVKPGQLHGFFTVIPEQPHAIAFELFPAELICYFEQERTGRGAIIRTDVRNGAEWPVSVVMACDHDDAVASARKFGNDVVNRKTALGRRDFEIIALHLIALKVRQNIFFHLDVVHASDRTRAESHDLFQVLHCTAGIEGRWSIRIGRISRD